MLKLLLGFIQSLLRLLVAVDHILKVAGWSNAETVARFYTKPIETAKSGYQKAVLKLWFIRNMYVKLDGFPCTAKFV